MHSAKKSRCFVASLAEPSHGQKRTASKKPLGHRISMTKGFLAFGDRIVTVYLDSLLFEPTCQKVMSAQALRFFLASNDKFEAIQSPVIDLRTVPFHL